MHELSDGERRDLENKPNTVLNVARPPEEREGRETQRRRERVTVR